MRKAAGFMFIIVLLLTGSIPLAANNSHSQIEAANTAVSNTNPLYLPVVLRNYMSSGNYRHHLLCGQRRQRRQHWHVAQHAVANHCQS